MGKLFCIMGKSSSGKDTLYRMLTDAGMEGLEKVVPYTTRPQREGEKTGREYFFCEGGGLSSDVPGGQGDRSQVL